MPTTHTYCVRKPQRFIRICAHHSPTHTLLSVCICAHERMFGYIFFRASFSFPVLFILSRDTAKMLSAFLEIKEVTFRPELKMPYTKRMQNQKPNKAIFFETSAKKSNQMNEMNDSETQDRVCDKEKLGE